MIILYAEKLLIYINGILFPTDIASESDSEPTCNYCKTKVPSNQIHKYKKLSADVAYYIFENRGGHPEPLEQVIHLTFVIAHSNPYALFSDPFKPNASSNKLHAYKHQYISKFTVRRRIL